MRAYVYIEDGTSPQESHDGGAQCIEKSVKELQDIGVLYWKLDGNDALQELDAIAAERQYANRDEVHLSREKLGDKLDGMNATFLQEHLHEDEEIRFIVDGCGYFDVRDKQDVWIRIRVEKGDMLIIPPGIYHRFLLDSKEYVIAKRLFREFPKWVPINRSNPEAEQNPYRLEYVEKYSTVA